MSSQSRQRFLKVALPVPIPACFDYLPLPGAAVPRPGTRVLVPFASRERVGMVVSHADHSEVPSSKLQFVRKALDEVELVVTGEWLRLLTWCAAYYQHPLGEVLFNALPPKLRVASGKLPAPELQYALTTAGRERLAQPPGREPAQWRLLDSLSDEPRTALKLRDSVRDCARLLRVVTDKGWIHAEPAEQARLGPPSGPELTDEQDSVLTELRADLGSYHCHLVDGVTGSGKTELYLRLIREVLEAGRQALILVPEIGLTPQLVRRFRERLGIEPCVTHSGMSAGERLRAWAGALDGRAKLFLGTRSALFLPLRDAGLIVMDESHDPSFKQQDGFRYSARDVAVKRARDLDIPIVLGSATPSLESLNNVRTGKYRGHRLERRATGALEPTWRVLDLRAQATRCGLCEPALDAIGQAIKRGEQVLVFLNRRGYAPVLLCHSCGWHADCPRCDANMTWHRSGRRLICHHCEERQPVPQFCPECSADALQGAGEGTEQLEKMLQERFDDTPLHRVDRDRMRRKGEMEQVVSRVREGQPCILVGTQMLAKGHHFPRVTLVVVVNLDQALYSADFRAMERMGQVLVQVAGRAGRAAHPGEVILQTHHPDHVHIETLVREGYGTFARALLEERRLAALPPFAHQALLRAEATERDRVLDFLNAAARCWPGEPKGLYGPLPAMMERRGGRYRWYLLLQNASRSSLQAALRDWLPRVRKQPTARRVRWAVDVDPQEF